MVGKSTTVTNNRAAIRTTAKLYIKSEFKKKGETTLDLLLLLLGSEALGY